MKPSIPKGTRDFSPLETSRREYIFETIRSVYKLYGYMPIETPAMEQLSTLTGKYGEEGDQLIFKILNSGDYWSKVNAESKENPESKSLTFQISEKALRYDLTVPFARYVVMHQHELTFPFKRYQIQPVWRADRPQKGRYREFFQCDADVIGSDSLLNELELIMIINEVFKRLKFDVVIKINHRSILSGIAEVTGESDKLIAMVTALDKLDKIGAEKVKEEMLEKNISQAAIDKIAPLFDMKGDAATQLSTLKSFLGESESGKKGLQEAEELLQMLSASKLNNATVEFDVTLARGLNYYTGCIIEVKAKDVAMGSICGGGRYDDLTGIFGLKGMSGVGISFGADRIYDVMEEKKLFQSSSSTSTQVLIVNFGKAEFNYALEVAITLREAGISCELYPDEAKFKKQLGYADSLKIPFVIMAGSEEVKNRKVTLKNMNSGDQQTVDLSELISILKD